MNINKLLIAISVLVAFTIAACSEYEDTIEPSPEVPAGNQGVYFPSSNTNVFELEPTAPTEITLTIARAESSGAVDVPIVVEINDEDVFNVPQTVSFADGETEKEFTVSFPSAGEGITYKLKLAVEGDEYVNPYATALPYVTTNVTRIKWEPVEEPMVYIDGTFTALFGVDLFPMYVNAEKAVLGDVVRYRFKNAYDVPSGDPDEDGIYDGYPYNADGDVDVNNDYYTIIEIDDPDGTSGDVYMFPHNTGVDWGYGMIAIGSKSNSYGKLANDVITFPSGSLFFSMANYNGAAKYTPAEATLIYLTKEAFIAANMKIEDYNDVEYEAIVGEVGEFESAAYSDNWSQTLAKAIDIDPENEESEYKDLYYLANLYAEGYGVAFYYTEGGDVKIPENQPIGREVFGKDIYVSPSETIESSVEVNAKGVSIYTLGLIFHFEDGTIVGDFAEKFFYSETAVVYAKEDFIGDFLMTGPSQFSGSDPANMNVTIAAGTDENSLVITGIDYAAEVTATYDPSTSMMSVAPQSLADYVGANGTYDMTLFTTDADGVSETSAIDFTFNMQGDMVIASTSVGDGYLLRSEAIGGWVDGYYNLVFSPVQTKSAGINTQSLSSFAVRSDADMIVKEADELSGANNFKVIGKKNPKKLKSNTQLVF